MFFLKKKEKGFTLVELMVAISLFIIVMTISLGSILSVFDSNRKSKALKAALTNINLAMESMSREMRFGSVYHCGSGTVTNPQDCPTGNQSIFSFLSSDNIQITYRLTNGSLEKQVGGGSFIQVTGPEVNIQDLDFYTIGSNTADTLQPKTLIVVRGTAGVNKGLTDFTLQTLVSQRVLDR